MSGNNVLYLLSANLEQEAVNSDPVLLYSVTAGHQLSVPVTILPARHTEGLDHSPVGVYSIHDADPYLVIEYPQISPRNSIFLSKTHPGQSETIDIKPESFVADTLGHVLAEPREGLVCDLWPLMPVPTVVDERGFVPTGKTTLRSACKASGSPAFLRSDEWSDYKNLRWDGDMRYREVSLLSSQDGKLVGSFVGGPNVVLEEMPSGFGAKPRSGPRNNPKDCLTDFGSPVCPNGVGVTLEAANASYLVVSIKDQAGQDRNADVFVRSTSDGKWKRLVVPAVSATETDKLRYRIFGSWLVTSLSALLQATDHITEAIVSEVLTVVDTGKQWADLDIKAEPRTAPDVAALVARRITLWNLADGRRIDLDLPEDDSEILQVFNDRTVLLRIHDKLFSASIQDSELTDYKLVAVDSAIPQIHWAFYSSP
ncbi:MAG: hypothetical protein ABSF28_16370 [Terracidiphilus sp.]|jgi:hypothetical protein